MNIKEKSILSAAFVISLFPMSLSWFGFSKGVQEIKGTIVLFNPVTIICIFAFFLFIWINIKNNTIKTFIPALFLLGIIGIELYEFFTWPIQTNALKFNLTRSFQWAYPEFYFGFAVSIAMLIFYTIYTRRTNPTKVRSI
jgi:hypothetical protein